MEFYSSYKLENLWPGMHKIAKLIIKSSDLDYRYRVGWIFLKNINQKYFY